MTQESNTVRARALKFLQDTRQAFLTDGLLLGDIATLLVAFAQSEREVNFRILASAMKKVLPPALLQEVIDHCDPLAAFLRESGMALPPAPDLAPKGNRADELPARDLGREYSNGRPRPKRY